MKTAVFDVILACFLAFFVIMLATWEPRFWLWDAMFWLIGWFMAVALTVVFVLSRVE